MPDNMPIPGRIKPSRRRHDRITMGSSVDWRPPKKKLQAVEDQPGTMICPRCHAISDIKRWYFDEERYQQLKSQPDVQVVRCPGCERIDRQLYGGEIHLRSPLLVENKEQVLSMIRNQEREAAENNPLARLAVVQDQDAEITILTTTAFLAERIGKEFKKAFDGDLRIDRLPAEEFSRVYWDRH